jgi:hypothetical protein
MAYLGNAPARSFISFERQVFTIVNSQTAYTLSHSVNNENDIRLVINNIVQEPGSGKAYTASGTTLTLSAALTNGTDEMYCVFLGRATATNAPGAGSVGTSQLASDAVTAAKLNDDIISGQTALGATPADTDEFLVSDAGTIKRVDYSYIKGLANWSESSGNLLPSNASYGIYLGVNSATAANLLDDYEEGTWTPAYTATGGSITATTTAHASYVKVGNMVYIQCKVATYQSSLTGDLSITGLPFTSSNVSNKHNAFAIGRYYLWNTDMPNLQVINEPNTSTLILFKNATNAGSTSRVQGSDTSGGVNESNLVIMGCYQVD